MILAIDAGNTNTVFAVYSGARLVNEWRISTHRSRTADEYIVWLSSVMSMEKVAGDEIKGAIISTVVPQMLFDLQQLCRRWFRVEPLVVGDPAVDLGIDIKVANPRDVGADRLVNAVAAHSAYKGPLMVLDFGTATTFDIVDADGAYRGGVIAPGINLSLEALHQAAAKLPRIAIRRPEHIIGTDTVSAMQSGVYWGYVGLIEGLVKRIRAEMGGEATVIATGGLARLFDAATEVIQHVETDLTMRGLVEIYHRNTV